MEGVPFQNNPRNLDPAYKLDLDFCNVFGREPPPLIPQPGPEVIKLFLCSAQLNMKFFLLINVKMPTIVGILTFMSVKNSIPGLSEPKKG